MKDYFEKVETIEFRKCDLDDSQNQEYALYYENNFLGYIEFYIPWKKFIFEPTNWVHITTDNLDQILIFMKALEAYK